MKRTTVSRGHVTPSGLACAVGGASLWGLSFVVPLYLPGVSSWDVSLGRYLVFGTVGALLVARGWMAGHRLSLRQWAWAFLFAATGYYGCYTVLVYAIAQSGAALPTLVMGLTPVAVALVGNLRSREVPFHRLLPPLLVMGAGLALANLARHGQGLSGRNLGMGLAASFAALGLLTFYLVANIFFLKGNPRVKPVTWANAIGCASMVFSVCALAARLFQGGGYPWDGTPTTAQGYLAGSLVLGIGVSWLGGVLWNRANAMLPAAVAGQGIVFWPVSGIVYACMVAGKAPSLPEAAGMAMVFAGVLWGLAAVRPARRAESPQEK